MEYSLGIDVGGTNLRIGLVSHEGRIVLHKKESTQARNPAAFLMQLENQIQAIHQESQVSFSGVGIGWPGPIDHLTKRIQPTPNIVGFEDFDLLGHLTNRFPKLRFQIENDAKCAGLAEQKFGAGVGLKDFILLTFGTGIGGVIFSNGQIMYGQTGGAGEMGHMTLHPQGISCSCGNLGCFEKYCSARAIEIRAGQMVGQSITASEIMMAVEKNEAWALRVFEDYCDDLALGIASLVNIFNPEAVIFGGGLFTTGGDLILEKVKHKISKRCFEKFQKNLSLKSSVLHGQAGLVGAASLFL